MSEQLTPAEMVAAIAKEHPGRHPFTLSLLLQARYGRIIDGREVARILRETIPVQTSTERLCLSSHQPANHDTLRPAASKA